MGMWSEIRREVLARALSKWAAIAKYKVGGHTLKKILAHDKPPGYRQAKQRPKPKLNTFPPLPRQPRLDERGIGPQQADMPGRSAAQGPALQSSHAAR